MEVVLAFIGVIVSPVAFGFAYGLLMRAGVDPLGVGGDIDV